MKQITDSLLLVTAEIAATLIGLLLVAVFFYLETGFRRLTAVGAEARLFLKATAKLLVFQYSMVVGLSLALVALRPLWVAVVFILLGIAIVAGVVEWFLRARSLAGDVQRAVHIQPWLVWPVGPDPSGVAVGPGGLGTGQAGSHDVSPSHGHRGVHEHRIPVASHVRPRGHRKGRGA